MPSDDSLTVKIDAEQLTEGGFVMEKWLSDEFLKKITELMNAHTHGPITLPAATVPPVLIDDLEPAVESLLRRDARLIQVLRGVRVGTISVEDAALEIIEGRGLGRPSEFLGSDALKLVKERMDFSKYVYSEWPQTLLGLPVKPDTSMKPGEFRMLNEFGINTIPQRPFIVDVKS